MGGIKKKKKQLTQWFRDGRVHKCAVYRTALPCSTLPNYYSLYSFLPHYLPRTATPAVLGNTNTIRRVLVCSHCVSIREGGTVLGSLVGFSQWRKLASQMLGTHGEDLWGSSPGPLLRVQCHLRRRASDIRTPM